MKIVYLAEIMWITDAYGQKKCFNSIVDELDIENTELVKKVLFTNLKRFLNI